MSRHVSQRNPSEPSNLVPKLWLGNPSLPKLCFGGRMECVAAAGGVCEAGASRESFPKPELGNEIETMKEGPR